LEGGLTSLGSEPFVHILKPRLLKIGSLICRNQRLAADAIKTWRWPIQLRIEVMQTTWSGIATDEFKKLLVREIGSIRSSIGSLLLRD